MNVMMYHFNALKFKQKITCLYHIKLFDHRIKNISLHSIKIKKLNVKILENLLSDRFS